MGWIIYTLLGIGIILLLVYIIHQSGHISKPNRGSLADGFLNYVDMESYLKSLKTTLGRYVRIYTPMNGDGYLRISQIQVLDMNGTNLALQKPVSTNVNPANFSGSADISVTVDGVTTPRIGLNKTWQAGLNYSNAYWQVDLGNTYQISEVIFTGRGDSDNIMLSGIAGMNAVIVDAQGQVVDSQSYLSTDITQSVTFPNFINLTPSPVDGVVYPISPLVISFNGSSNISTNSFPFIDLERVYEYVIENHGSAASDLRVPRSWIQARPDMANSSLYSTLVITSPINLLYELGGYDVNQLQNMNCNIHYVGTITDTAMNQMKGSIDLCKKIFLGATDDIDKFINIRYDDLQPYIRSSTGQEHFCRTELIQSVQGTDYKTVVSEENKSFNNGHCSTLFTNDMLGLLPYAARTFIIQWIYSRTIRIMKQKYINDSSLLEKSVNTLKFMIPTVNGQRIGLDINNKAMLDSIAQSFYESMNGKYIMSTIIHISTIGDTILDLRFDLQKQSDTTDIQNRIKEIKDKYTNIQKSTQMSQDILDQARNSYESNVAKLEEQLAAAVLPPIQGVVGRFFYTYDTSNGTFSISGFSMDSRCVTSFLSEFNCGPKETNSAISGNVNYAPTIQYTYNTNIGFACNDRDTLRRIMNDYIDAVDAGDIKLTNTIDVGGNKAPDVNIKKYTLRIDKIRSARTNYFNNMQCDIIWDEIPWDDVANKPQPSISRAAKFPYTIDKGLWGSDDAVFDISGFAFMPKPNDMGIWDTPIIFPKPVPTNNYLDNASGGCRNKTTCEDLDILFRIADQYNNDPTVPGSILRITRAVTANKYQCDIEADIEYDSTIANAKGVMVKKGSFSYNTSGAEVPVTTPLPSGLIKGVKLSTYVHMNISNCSIQYDTAKDSTKGGGTFIQDNIPQLYKPMEYASQIKTGVETTLSSMMDSLSSNISAVTSSTAAILPDFRKNTLSSAGAIGFLGSCPTTSCKDTAVLNEMIRYYTSNNLHKKQINTITRVGTLDANTCDITYQEDTLIPSGNTYKVSSSTTSGMRFTMQPSKRAECAFDAVNMFPILPQPPDDLLRNINTISTGNKAFEVFHVKTSSSQKDAANICSTYGGGLATYDQLVAAQNAGAHWCSPGWISGTVATFFSKNPDGTEGPIVSLGAGEYGIDPMKTSGIINDGVYKVDVPTGLEVTLFSGGGFDGDSLTLTSSSSSLGRLDKQTSSIRIKSFGYFPVTTDCGTGSPGVNKQPISNGLAGATCYAIKPMQTNDTAVIPFSESSWNIPVSFDSVKMPTTVSDTSNPYVNPNKEAFTNYGAPIQITESTFPLDTPSFGLDRIRNKGGDLNSMYDEPLRQADAVVHTHTNKGNSYKYIRFRPIKTRSPDHPSVHISKFRFFLGNQEIDIRNAKVTNPLGTWVGDIQDVNGDGYRKGWSDMNKKALVFAFPYAVLMDGFTWTTANPDNGIEGDPVRWKLESSQNGVYWTTVHDRTRVSYPVPHARFQELPIIRF